VVQAKRRVMYHGACKSTSRQAFVTKFALLFIRRVYTTDSRWQLRSGVLGGLFRPDTYLTSESGAGNNWAKGCALPLILSLCRNADIVLQITQKVIYNPSVKLLTDSRPGAELVDSILVSHIMHVTDNPTHVL